jgi:hypothetical protein
LVEKVGGENWWGLIVFHSSPLISFLSPNYRENKREKLECEGIEFKRLLYPLPFYMIVFGNMDT